MPRGSQATVDAVIVAYNSASTLRAAVAPLTASADVHVIVADNASPDDTASAVAGLDVELVRVGRNGGFAAGCNAGAARGRAPYVLLLNPDARITPEDVRRLALRLETDPSAGICAPRILESDGTLAYSLRRFPRRRSTFAQALFLHRLWPLAPWTDELMRDPAAYEAPASPEWVSGACMLVRRSALEAVGGLDERFFLYCEDMDLCARIRAAGYAVRFEPTAVARHVGGASAPRENLLGIYARNRVRYARKHGDFADALLEAVGVALGHMTHAVACALRPDARRGHLRALIALLRPPAIPAGRPQESR